MDKLVDIDDNFSIIPTEVAGILKIRVDNPNYIPPMQTKTTFNPGRGEPFLEDKTKIILKNGFEYITNTSIEQVKKLLNERV